MLNINKGNIRITSIFNGKVRKIVTIFLAISFICYSLTGCYTHSRGGFVRTEKIPGTSVLEDYTYQVILESRPTVNRPTVNFHLIKIPRYKVETVNLYAEQRKPSHTAGWIATIIGGGLLYGASEVDTLKKGGKDLRTGLLIGGLIFFLPGIYTIAEPSTPESTGKTIEGEKGFTYEEGTQISLDRTRIAASIGSRNNHFVSNSRGRVEINLVNDFNFRTFESPERLKLRINSRDPQMNYEITLDPSNWTVPHIRIRSDARSGWIFEKPSATSKRIFEYRPLNIFRILDDRDPNWWQVDANGTTGWIPSGVGTKFWSVLN